MAVEAVGAVVIQRVTDLLIQKSNVFDNLIDEVEDIRLHLRLMYGSHIDAEERRLSQDPEAQKWAEKYLKTLFCLEDEAEKYVLGLVRRRRFNLIVFLERRTGFFLHDCFRSGRTLRHHLKSIKVDISELKKTKPGQETSLVGSCSNYDDDNYAEEIGRENAGGGMTEDDAIVKGSTTSSVSINVPSTEAGGTERDLKKITSSKNLALGSPSSFSPGKHSRKIPINLCKAHSFPGSRSPAAAAAAAAAAIPQRRISFWQKCRTVSKLKRDLGIVGFQEDIDKLVNRLTKGKFGVIPVVGPSGSGKTTLVRAVYNHLDTKTHFGHNRVWVHLQNEAYTSPTGLWMKMVQEITKSKENGLLDLEQLKKKLIDFLKGEEEHNKRRYMIVLDSVQSLDVWEQLEAGFPNLAQRESKVILITRDNKLAASVSLNHHSVAKLNEEDSWKLFLEKLCPHDEEILRDHPIFRSKILEKCDNRPLNISLLGGLLSTKALGYDEWSWYLTQARWQNMDILSLSYKDLPAHSKLCLLYMSLFPAEVDISVRRLHRLWLAEGFIRRSPGMTEEESVEECFDDLVERNLISISKLKSDESSRNCRLPSSIRDFLLPKAADISLFHIHVEGNSPSHRGLVSRGVVPRNQRSWVRNLLTTITIKKNVEGNSSNDPNGVEGNSSNDPNGLGVRRIVEYAEPRISTSPDSNFEHLRSYLSFNSQKNDIPAKKVGNFISKNIIGKKGFGLLRVLDLEGVYKPTLPKTLKQLFHLRYLGLRWTFIDDLPDSVGDLPYLETLDLKRTCINRLPSSIRKLRHLRYLNLPNICLEHEENGELPSSFTELQILLGLVIDENTPVKNDLDQLLKLRELSITCKLSSSESTLAPIPDLWIWIQKLKSLQSLWLKSTDEMGRPSKITLESVKDLEKLSYMSLMGNLGKLVGANLPSNLKVISLSVSRLDEDPMPMLAKLPQLTVLRLLADSYLGERMVCPKGGFIKLRVLKMWMLKNLVEWKVEEEGMPCIKELNIRYCCKLQQFPTELLKSTLKEVTLTSMPENIVEEVRNKKGHQVTINVNEYEFTELPWERETDHDLWQES